MPLPAPSLSAFGKLPTHGDFVRHQAGSDAVRALDEWLQHGLFFAQAQRSPRLEEAYGEAPALAFLFRRDVRHAPLLGVLRPSRDSAGRRFPFVIVRELGPGEPSGWDLVLREANYLQEAADLLAAICAGEFGHREVGAQVEERIGARALGAGRVDRSYHEQTSLRAFGEAVWDYFEDSRKYLLFSNLLDLFGRRADAAPNAAGRGAGLRFPLDPSAPIPSAAFWLEAVCRLGASSLEEASYFFTLGGGAGARGAGEERAPADHLVLFLQPPPPKVFAELLALAPPGDRVWDLETIGREHAADAALSIPPRYGMLLEDGQLSLDGFLNRL